MIENIRWLGHGGFVIQGTQSIFIDPWRVIRSAFHADIILITHDHYDHCSTADIAKLRGPQTIIIGNELVAEKIEGTTVIRPWQSMSFDRISIKAIPAYAPDGVTHKKEEGGLGFIISVNYYDIYYTGDTKIIPEMQRVSPDIIILPIDNHDTLSVDEAVQVIDNLSPRWVIPCNWGSTSEGASELDAQDFKAKIGGRAEVVLPRVDSDSVM